MRYGILFLLATITGCAHIEHQDPQTGLEVTYTGSARGAVDLVHATDPRSYDLASKAMDKDMATSLARDADGDVRFNAGYGYGWYYDGSVVGYAPGNVGFIPGQSFVTGPQVSTLPPLATSVVATGVPSTQATGGAIVPCPTDRVPTGDAERLACVEDELGSLTRNRTK